MRDRWSIDTLLLTTADEGTIKRSTYAQGITAVREIELATTELRSSNTAGVLDPRENSSGTVHVCLKLARMWLGMDWRKYAPKTVFFPAFTRAIAQLAADCIGERNIFTTAEQYMIFQLTLQTYKLKYNISLHFYVIFANKPGYDMWGSNCRFLQFLDVTTCLRKRWVRPSVHPSIHESVHLSFHLSVCPFLRL